MEKSQNIKIKSAFTYLFIYNFSWIWNTFSKEFLRFYEVLTNTSSRQLVTYVLYWVYHQSMSLMFTFNFCSPTLKKKKKKNFPQLIPKMIWFFFCIKAELKIMVITITWIKNLHRISKTFPGDLIHMSTHLP